MTLTRIAIGIASYAAPLYISEIAPKRKRGALVVLNTITVTGGIVIAYVVDLLFAAHGGWRWMFGLGIVPAILLGAGLLLLPPSPRWIARQGFIPLAKIILHKLHEPIDADHELQEITRNIRHEKKATWRAVFAPKTRVLIILGIGLAVIQQITGINTILYYAPTIFKFVGFQSTTSQLLATLGMGLMNFIMTIVAMFYVDKLGRRRLLLVGLAMMTIAIAIVAFIFHHGVNTTGLKWLSVFSLLVFVAFYALSIGCLFWLIISEIYPLNLRGRAMSLAAMSNWFANLIVALSFLSLITSAGPAITFMLYAIAGVFSWLFSYWLVPETKQVSLEQIERNLFAGKRCRDIGQ